MKKSIRTVKTHILTIVLPFVLIISFLIAGFSQKITMDYQEQILLQSMDGSIGLIAGTIERDLVDLAALAAYYGSPAGPVSRYFLGEYSDIFAFDSYNTFNERYYGNRVSRYVSRALAVQNDGALYLQTGTSATGTSKSVGSELVAALEQYAPLESSVTLYPLSADPFSSRDNLVLPILYPVYASYSSAPIGTVYLAINTTLFTDAVSGFPFSDGQSLYLSIHGEHYRISANSIELIDELPNTGLIVTKTVRSGISLTIVSAPSLMLGIGEWGSLLFLIFTMIVLLTFLMIALLNRTVSRPIERIHKKINAIASGDFSYDASIESNNEIGEVGRGINRLSSSVTELMETRIADEQRKRDLEYQALQSQINPHFLYNTLNSIKWMATFQKADGIAEMVTALSRLLKTLAKDLRQTVTLEEEVALLEDYFVIMKYRYGGAIQFQKEIPDKLLDCMIPRFVLQPLMENAIFHGLEPKGKGLLRLTAEQVEQDIYIHLWDNGAGMSSEKIYQVLYVRPNNQGTTRSLGIYNVHERLQYAFGPSYGVAIESIEDEYTEMTLKIPYCAPEHTSKGEEHL